MASPVSYATPSRVRYVVLLLTVAAYLITYLDRTLLSAAAPSIQKEFSFSLETLGWVLASYQFAYALFQIPGGWLGDKFGPRFALTGVVIWWSVFTAFTTLTWSVTSLAVVLFLFGMGEAGAFPIATRSLSCWILPSERGFAQGATHAGSRFGGAITPIIATFLIARYGWRMPFLVFAIPGLIWAAVWFWYYRDTPAQHKGVNKSERALIEGALGTARPGSKEIPWRIILGSPRMWLLSAMYFCYGVIVIIFITWFPKYLSAARGLNLQQMGLYASLPLAAAVVGGYLWRLVFRPAIETHGADHICAQDRSRDRLLYHRPDHSDRGYGSQSHSQHSFLLFVPLCNRADGRKFLGRDLGYRRQLRGVRVCGHEHVRQYRRRGLCGPDGLHRHRVWLASRVLRSCQFRGTRRHIVLLS